MPSFSQLAGSGKQTVYSVDHIEKPPINLGLSLEFSYNHLKLEEECAGKFELFWNCNFLNH